MRLIPQKLIFIFSLFLFSAVISGSFVFAQRDLEVPLPGIGGEVGFTETPLLPNYIKYIFNFSIGIGGFVVFVVMIYGGFRYLTSAGNPSAAADAKDRIFSAVLGLGLLLGSWVLLTTINPQLIIINPQLNPSKLQPVGDIPGVYLCKSAESLLNSKDCQLFQASADKLGSFNNLAGYVKLKNPKKQDGSDEFQYGAVLHEDEYYRGRCRICLGDGCDFSYVRGASSINVFAQDPNPQAPPPDDNGLGVTFYQLDNYDGKGWFSGPLSLTSLNPPYTKDYTELGFPPGVYYGRSIKVENEGKYLVALFEQVDGQHKCEVFTLSDPGLDTNYIGECGNFGQYGCFTSAAVMPIRAKF